MVATITSGHHAIVYVSANPDATFAGEATTQTETGRKLTISDNKYDTEPIQRVIHPTEPVTQHWTSGPTGSTITVNRLRSRCESTADESANTLTLDGHYLELAKLAYCKDFSLRIEPILDDVTPFGTKYREFSRGLVKVSGTLGNFFDATQIPTGVFPDGFTTGIAPYFSASMIADSQIVIKLYVHANLSILAWAKVNSEQLHAAVEGQQEETVGWVGYPDLEGHVLSRL